MQQLGSFGPTTANFNASAAATRVRAIVLYHYRHIGQTTTQLYELLSLVRSDAWPIKRWNRLSNQTKCRVATDRQTEKCIQPSGRFVQRPRAFVINWKMKKTTLSPIKRQTYTTRTQDGQKQNMRSIAHRTSQWQAISANSDKPRHATRN